jgi:hypothetical protein
VNQIFSTCGTILVGHVTGIGMCHQSFSALSNILKFHRSALKNEERSKKIMNTIFTRELFPVQIIFSDENAFNKRDPESIAGKNDSTFEKKALLHLHNLK